MWLGRYLAITAAILLSPTARAQDFDFLYALIDANHDDSIDRQESGAFASMQWGSLDPQAAGSVSREVVLQNPRAAMLIGDLLPAEGVKLSRKQFVEGLEQRFAKADINRDGAVNAAEFRAIVGAPPARPASTAAMVTLPSVAQPFATGLPLCADMSRDPRYGLAGNKGISSLSATKIAANAQDAAYCQVQFVYNSGLEGPKDGYDDGQRQAITIRIGLPLRPDDGGGAVGWNGRIQNVGSGGCMGALPSVTVATNAGFASASSDGGHGAPYLAFNCGFGVIQSKGELNKGLIRDFSDEHVRWQTAWSKALVKTYYGQPARYTYWCGCSQGGREGFIALQTVPEEYDGILAGGAALYWMRFHMAQAWSGVVIKDMLRSKGKDLTPVQIAATVQQEVAACDLEDGVKDGELADPRQCRWSAKAAMCSVAGAKQGECLDADQAAAFDVIRRGPRNHLGQMIWFPWEPGTTFANQTDYLLADGMMQWAVRDLGFRSDAHLYMDKAALKRAKDPKGITYEDMATLASQGVSDLIDWSSPAVTAAARSGVKVIGWTGTADRNIPSRNTIKYYRKVAASLGHSITDTALQDWFRVFLYPGVDHCAGGVGAQPGNLYNGPLVQALIEWVEKDRAPERIIATKRDEKGVVARTRPVCAYPKTAIYRGQGSTDDAASFICGGNLETPQILAADKLALHKKENGTGVIPGNYKHKSKAAALMSREP